MTFTCEWMNEWNSEWMHACTERAAASASSFLFFLSFSSSFSPIGPCLLEKWKFEWHIATAKLSCVASSRLSVRLSVCFSVCLPSARPVCLRSHFSSLHLAANVFQPSSRDFRNEFCCHYSNYTANWAVCSCLLACLPPAWDAAWDDWLCEYVCRRTSASDSTARHRPKAGINGRTNTFVCRSSLIQTVHVWHTSTNKLRR